MAKTAMKSFGTSSRLGHDSSGFYARKLHAPAPEGASVAEVPPESPESPESEVGQVEYLNQLYQHSSESMVELPDNSVHLMVTSPPYNVGKAYDDDLSMRDYLDMLGRVWHETYRVLVPGGRACVNVANLGRKPYIPLNALISTAMIDIGFLMRGEIIWDKAASAGTSCAWGSWLSASNPVLRDTHEYIMVFCKLAFARKSQVGASTISKDDFLDGTKSVWTFPAASAKRIGHPAPFPEELPRRLIELYTFTGDAVLDPFMGSGQTAVAAAKGGRQWVGYDTSAEYIELAMQRINETKKPES